MLRLPKKILFAIEAVLDIAYHAGAQPVQSRDITLRQGIPRRYLEQALQSLVRQGVLQGVRGPRGGYLLARERRRITVADIITAVNKDAEEAAIKNGSPGEGTDQEVGSELGQKVIYPLWQTLENDMMKNLQQINFDDLCNQADNLDITSQGRENLDFNI